MSTNYYFKLEDIKKQELINNIKKSVPFTDRTHIENVIEKLTEIHIGIVSIGWKPLFQVTKFYRSITDLQNFYSKYKEFLKIENEYGRELSWDKLEEELINHEGNYSHLEYHGKKVTGDKELFEMMRKHYYMDYMGYEWSESDFS